VPATQKRGLIGFLGQGGKCFNQPKDKKVKKALDRVKNIGKGNLHEKKAKKNKKKKNGS